MLSLLLIALILSQNALDGNLQRGSGTALDRPLQHGATVNSASQREDYRARNLVVTGNAAGGRSFRGSVGYTAAEDFRGATAGDSTQSFRSNAAISSADALASITMNDRFSVATGMGIAAYRRDFTVLDAERGNAEALSGPIRTGLVGAAPSNDARLQLDNMTRQAAFSSELSAMYQPTTIQITRSSDQRRARIISNPFVGIIAVPEADLIESLSNGVYGSALMRADLRSGRTHGSRILKSYLSGLSDERSPPPSEMATGTKLDTQLPSTASGVARPTDSATAGRLSGGATAPRKVLEIRSPYDRVVTTLTKRYQHSQGEATVDGELVDGQEISEVNSFLGDVRASLQLAPNESREGTSRLLAPRRSAADGAADTTGGDASAETAADAATQPAGANPNSDSNAAQSREGSKPIRALTADEAYLLMAHGETMSQLDGGTQEALDTLLRVGDRMMRARRFLSAEKIFGSGAAIAPSNPLPAAGIANAQVAAGLQLAAAMSLRRLFTMWPEMIDTRYAHDILGSTERLREIAAESLSKSEGSQFATEYGFIAAYVGHQLSDAEITAKGLSIMNGNPSDRALVEALRGIWSYPVRTAQPVIPAEAAIPAPIAAPTENPAPAASTDPPTNEVRPLN
ncbi:MAG: hypothetical protein EXS15_04540 [Phycisphaerales bacterium]|nr:hypothetical protein [Phycisphaerales bacterium]